MVQKNIRTPELRSMKTIQPRCARELHSFLSLRERMRHPCSEAGFFDSDEYY